MHYILFFLGKKRQTPTLTLIFITFSNRCRELDRQLFFFIMRSLIVTTTQGSRDWLMVVGSGYPHSSTSRGVRWMYRETKTSYLLLSQGVTTWTLAKHHLQSSSCTCPSRNQQPALFVRHSTHVSRDQVRVCYQDVSIQSPLLGLHHLKNVSISYIYICIHT